MGRDVARPIRVLSLFSGVGGLELAIGLCFRRSQVVGYVERDAYACRSLVARMEESSLDPAPVFVGEVQDVDGSEFLGHVDVVCGGIPCQPYSVAGDQKGNEDDRALWPEFARIVAECRPSLVFIENVPTFVTGGGFRPLGEELCRLGYELADPFFIGAGDIGAPHERQRVFILAYRDLDGSEDEWGFGELVEGIWPSLGNDPDRRGEEVAGAEELDRREREPERGPEGGASLVRSGEKLGDSDGARWSAPRKGRQEYSGAEPEEGSEREVMAHPGGEGRKGDEREELRGEGRQDEGRATPELREAQGWTVGEGGVPDAERDALRVEPERGFGRARSPESWDAELGDMGLFPPGPDDEGRWIEFIQERPHLRPSIEPGLCVVVDGVPVVLDESYADQLRCSGNAVVVAQSFVAFQWLFRQAIKGDQ